MIIQTKTYNHWEKDLESSVNVTDILVKALQMPCEIYDIQNNENPILKLLDQDAGMDWICKTKDNQFFGIAVRVQWIEDGMKPFNSFTIRFERNTGSKTEYEKRIAAIKDGYFYPKLTLQSYFRKNTNQLLSIGLIETKLLFSFINKEPDLVHENYSDNKFKYVNWKDIESKGIKMLRFEPKQKSMVEPAKEKVGAAKDDNFKYIHFKGFKNHCRFIKSPVDKLIEELKKSYETKTKQEENKENLGQAA